MLEDLALNLSGLTGLEDFIYTYNSLAITRAQTNHIQRRQTLRARGALEASASKTLQSLTLVIANAAAHDILHSLKPFEVLERFRGPFDILPRLQFHTAHGQLMEMSDVGSMFPDALVYLGILVAFTTARPSNEDTGSMPFEGGMLRNIAFTNVKDFRSLDTLHLVSAMWVHKYSTCFLQAITLSS